MFSRPVSSGWNPVPTSSRLPTRPRTSARPSVGSVIRDRIFSSVLLPAPLWPMTPSTSPGATSTETSRRAQMVLSTGFGGCERKRRTGAEDAHGLTCHRGVLGERAVMDEVTPELAAQMLEAQALIAQGLLKVGAAVPAVPLDRRVDEHLAMEGMADLGTLECHALVD